MQETWDSIPGLGRSPGEGNGYPLQHSCLENPTDRGAQRATVHRVAKSKTGLKRSTHSSTYTVYLQHQRFHELSAVNLSTGKVEIFDKKLLT